MSETQEQERQALVDLVESPGWQIYVEEARAQWQGERFVGRMKIAMSGQAPDASACIREVFAGRAAIESLLQWPELRAKTLAAAAVVEPTDEIVRRA